MGLCSVSMCGVNHGDRLAGWPGVIEVCATELLRLESLSDTDAPRRKSASEKAFSIKSKNETEKKTRKSKKNKFAENSKKTMARPLARRTID